MVWQATPYTIPLLVIAILAVISAAYIVGKRPQTPGLRLGVLLLLASAAWLLAWTLELASADLASKIFWAKLQVVGIAVIPIVWPAFAIQYTGQEKLLTRRALILLALIPLLTVLLAFTNESHHLIWSKLTLNVEAPFARLERQDNIGAWGFMAYVSIVFCVAAVALARARRLFNRQTRLLLAAALVPWAGSALMFLGLNPFPHLNPAPLAATLTSLVIAWGLDFVRLGDIMPAAHRTVVEVIRDGVIVLDAHNRIAHLNPAAQDLLGCAASQSAGQPIGQVWPDWAALRQMASDDAEASRVVALGQDDRQRVYDVRMSPLLDWQGQVISRVFVLRDITPYKQAEERLREAEMRYRALVEQIPVVVYVNAIDEAGYTIYISPRVETLLGYLQEEWFADPELRWRAIHRDDRERVQAASARASASGDSFQMEYRMTARDRRVVWVRDEAVLVRDEAGQPQFWRGVLMDITAHKRAEELQRAKESAEAANQAKSAFLANMSHELRTPLTSIIGYTELILEKMHRPSQADLSPYLERILGSGKHLLGLINDILDLSRIEAGRMSLSLETFDIQSLVNELAVTVRPMVEKNANSLQVHCSTNLGAMRADPVRVRQVLLNLLGNAAKFTQNGLVKLEVLRETMPPVSPEEKASDWIIFRVSDTGIGLSPEQMRHVFEPFWQADASTTRKYGGSGLGLAISHSFSRMMGGAISVQSEAGKGSTFTVRLPAEVATHESSAAGD